jgi:mannose-6-phosphate isomerase-like protein (cupin superfamily)
MPDAKKIIDKPWGREELLYETDDFVVLKLFIRKGEETSLHKHSRRNEYFVVIKGDGCLLCDGLMTKVRRGTAVIVRRGREHRWIAGEHNIEIVEVTTPPLSDLLRLKDRYGRA